MYITKEQKETWDKQDEEMLHDWRVWVVGAVGWLVVLVAVLTN